MTAEIGGVSSEIRKEGGTSEALAENLNRLRLEEKRLEEESEKLNHSQQKLNAQIKILQQSLQTTEASATVVQREKRRTEDQMNIIEDNIMKIHTQAQNLFEEAIHRINEHKALEKKTANFLKQATSIRQEIDEKEVEREGVENEVARVAIDALNTTSQTDVLKQKKREVSEERRNCGYIRAGNQTRTRY